MSTLTTVILYSFRSPKHDNQRRKRNKVKQTGKLVKLSLFTGDIILYIENPKDATSKLLHFMTEFTKIVGYKINTHKSIEFLYTNNKT